nr:ribonuclease H-like domain, reverse transcriptase, RNA-dependent DNA polymerase [Tanacetum cinerariifolium]
QDRATIAKSSTLPHDSAPRVTSPAADEGSMQQNISELTALCTSLQRQYSELMSKFQAQEEEIGRLKEQVQVLEDRGAVATKQSGENATIKGRKKMPQSRGRVTMKGRQLQERISNDSEEIAGVLTSMDAATVLAGETNVPTSSGFIPTAGPSATIISTGSEGEFNTDFHPMLDFITASPLRYALIVKPTIFVSHIRQFWSTARIETTDEGAHILATVDGIQRTVSEASLRCNLKLRDEDGIVSIPDTELFENLTLMGYNISQNQKLTFQKGQFSHQWKYLIHTIMQCLSPKSTRFNEFSSNIATALVCLATTRTYNFSNMIFDGMVKNVNNKVSKFLMYPRAKHSSILGNTQDEKLAGVPQFFWLQSTNGNNNRLNDGSNNGLRIWYWSFSLDNRRLDVFGYSVISRRHHVLCHLGITFHYFRRRRGSRNRGSLICSSTLSGDTLQIVLWSQLAVKESGVDELELGNPRLGKLEVVRDNCLNDSLADYGYVEVGKNYHLDRLPQHIRSGFGQRWLDNHCRNEDHHKFRS